VRGRVPYQPSGGVTSVVQEWLLRSNVSPPGNAGMLACERAEGWHVGTLDTLCLLAFEHARMLCQDRSRRLGL